MTNLEFIAAIAPIVQKYVKVYGVGVPSAIIAQACIESAYGRSTLSAKYHNYFGIKGWSGHKRVVNMRTKEEYTVGSLTSITAGFCVYDTLDEGIKGYFEFITRNSRYRNLKGITTPEEYLNMIRRDGYATSSTYVQSNLNVVNTYNLRQYDGTHVEKAVSYAGIVMASALNVRTAPSTSAEILQVAGSKFILPRGMCVAICAECNGWGRLSDIGGWVSLQYIKS